MEIKELFDLDPEQVTPEQRKALMAEYRETRAKFAALDALGKATKKKKPEKKDADLLNEKVVG